MCSLHLAQSGAGRKPVAGARRFMSELVVVTSNRPNPILMLTNDLEVEGASG